MDITSSDDIVVAVIFWERMMIERAATVAPISISLSIRLVK